MDSIKTPDKIAQEVDAIIHEVVGELALNAAILALQTEIPALKLPVVSQALRLILSWIFGYVDQGLEQVAAFQIIDSHVTEEQKAYSNAVENLKAAQASGDQSAINQAKEDFKKSLGSLIHFDGSPGK